VLLYSTGDAPRLGGRASSRPWCGNQRQLRNHGATWKSTQTGGFIGQQSVRCALLPIWETDTSGSCWPGPARRGIVMLNRAEMAANTVMVGKAEFEGDVGLVWFVAWLCLADSGSRPAATHFLLHESKQKKGDLSGDPFRQPTADEHRNRNGILTVDR
jgi:hypothetical protein